MGCLCFLGHAKETVAGSETVKKAKYTGNLNHSGCSSKE